MLGEFLLSVGVLCGIATLLAVLMVIADATLGNYGTIGLTVNDEREWTVDGGRPLLATLKEKGVFIPSACGGRGSCGLCKVTITEGAEGHLATELPWLTPEERSKGLHLSCQIKVKRPLRIRIPPEWLSVRQFATTVTSIRDLTYDIKEVRLRLVDPPEIQFKPGQFVQFEVPEYELTDEPVYRAYSISSPPSSAGEIELEIRLVPNGICTTYVHRHLKVGDKVTLNGPYGEFFLHDSQRDIVFVAGGSGMAPVKSILQHMVETKNTRRARYFFGAKARRDLFLVDEMRALEKTLPDFHFIPALSEPAPDDRWEGETGLITQVLDRQMASGDNMEAYLCGSPLMIDACIAVLKAKGVPENLIFYDKFA